MEEHTPKLLILGGNSLSSDIVRTAKEMGVYTIVTDWNDVEQSPAKKIADKHFEISINDYDQLLELIKTEGINGILTGFSDSYLEIYANLCQLAGLPSYATAEQFRWTIDKNEFKEKCKKYHIPVVPEYDINDILAQGKLPCPKIILKPVDNSGSRGIHIVDKYDTFKPLLDETLKFSPKKHVIAERYMDCNDVSLCYTIRNGISSLSAICDRYIHSSEKGGSVTSGLIYPSKYIDTYLSNIDEKVKNMLHKEKLDNGVLFMQAFVDNGNFYFYEMGYRLSGGRHYVFTKEENNISAIEELVNFALSGKMGDMQTAERDSADFSAIYSQVSILCKSDAIHKFKGIDYLQKSPNVIDYMINYKEGDEIGQQGTTQQIAARIHIKAKDIQELKSVVRAIGDNFKVLNKAGENLIIDLFNPENPK